MSDRYMIGLYVLADDMRTPVRVSNTVEWGRWFEVDRDRKRVGLDEVSPGVVVSTVFLGLDHQYRDGPPLLFETMIFAVEALVDIRTCADVACEPCNVVSATAGNALAKIRAVDGKQ